VDLQAYLGRIGYSGIVSPDLETLQAIHRAHFLNVPFENLDISRGVRIEVDEAVNFDKIVMRHRGGFCLELTGTFARALRQIGFRVDVIGARVLTEGHLSYPMSHMTLIVHLDEDWIADVGFGGRIVEPLRLSERGEQVFGMRRYVVENDGDHWFVTCIETGYDTLTYTFVMRPREFEEFHTVCDWLQTSPDSRFTQGDVISLATPIGRTTLARGRLITFDGATREEQEVASTEDQHAIIREQFGINL
jgi:N-hydroxyarylamine O-acetyltransferase